MRVGKVAAVAMALAMLSQAMFAQAIFAQAEPAQTLTIGLGAPLSGPDAIFGTQIQVGAAQAIEDANAAGGFLGQPAQLVARDDADAAKRGLEIAADFVRAKTPIVIGHFSSAVTLPTSALYAEAGIFDITPSAIAPEITDRGLATMFRMCGREDQQAAVAARYLPAHFTRIAIVHDRSANGTSLANAMRAQLAASGHGEIFYGSLEKGTRDFATLVGRLRASGAEAVFWGGAPLEAGLLVQQLRAAGSDIVLMGGFALASDAFVTVAGGAADGTLMVFPRDPRSRPEATALARRLTAKGIELGAYTFYAYAAVQVIREAVATSGTLDPGRLAATLHSGMIIKTVVGDLAFDGHGDRSPTDLTVYSWHKTPNGRMAYDEKARS